MTGAEWGSQALAWVRSLSGDQREAISRQLEGEAAHVWARLVYASSETTEERDARIRATEGKETLTGILDWLTR